MTNGTGNYVLTWRKWIMCYFHMNLINVVLSYSNGAWFLIIRHVSYQKWDKRCNHIMWLHLLPHFRAIAFFVSLSVLKHHVGPFHMNLINAILSYSNGAWFLIISHGSNQKWDKRCNHIMWLHLLPHFRVIAFFASLSVLKHHVGPIITVCTRFRLEMVNYRYGLQNKYGSYID